MSTVTISPKYQVVIPKKIRESLRLRPGQKMQKLEYDGRIEMIPERDIAELRGFLKGINTEFKTASNESNFGKYYPKRFTYGGKI